MLEIIVTPIEDNCGMFGVMERTRLTTALHKASGLCKCTNSIIYFKLLPKKIKYLIVLSNAPSI